MKKKLLILLAIVAILFVGATIWYNQPIDLLNLDHNEVLEIVIFDGNSGNVSHIKDKEKIQHIIDNLNDIEMKKTKPSSGYSGYSYKFTIYLLDGNTADGWNNFIINSDDTIRKDPFFYSVINGKIDFDYIKDIVE